MEITQALAQLDPANESQWTSDGLPRVEAVVELVGHDVTRKQITDAAPTFSRSVPVPGGSDTAPQEQEPEFVPGPPIDYVPDDADVGKVAPQDDACGMTPEAITRAGPVVIDRLLAEFERQAVVLARRREQATKALKELGMRSAFFNKIKDRLPQKKDDKSVQAYLAKQKEVRAERAEKAKAFVEAGTTPQAVMDVVDSRAKIDKAMAGRKPGRGATRPAHPIKEA